MFPMLGVFELIGLLYILLVIAAFVLFIIVLVKLFENEGVGMGILGLFCSLYTFIWGWQKHKELNLTNVMTAWSALFIIGIILLIISTIAGMQFG